MKYLHVCPPWYSAFGDGTLRQPNVPLGAAYCARAALKAGWRALIWNGDLQPEGGENQYSEEMAAYRDYLKNQPSDDEGEAWAQLRRVLDDLRPDVVGITVLTPAIFSALRVVALVKERFPNTRTILGGPHVSALPEEMAAQPGVDAAVFGEGEETLRELLDRWCRGESVSGLPGVAVRDGAGVIRGPDRALSAGLDELGWPAKGLILDPRGLMTRDNFGWIMFSRGCPCKCEFCASSLTWTCRVRWRSARDMAAEMAAVHAEYDTRYFSFEDDTFTINRRRVLELMTALMETGLPRVPGFRWTCNTRPERVDAELLDRMREAGCAAVAVGIEFGSARILKKMQKGFTPEDVRKAIRLIKTAGLVSSGQFMVGVPTETEEEMRETVRLADELECESVMLSVATPLPGTPLYQEAVRLGLVPAHGVDWRSVTTKNDGLLMTVVSNGRIMPMPLEQRQRIVAEIHEAFDRIQARTLAAKNASRLKYESQYITGGDRGPVYGFRKPTPSSGQG